MQVAQRLQALESFVVHQVGLLDVTRSALFEKNLELAMRVDGRLLTDAGLEAFLVPDWGPATSEGGA